MSGVEVNFDGLVGPTHNYAGLSFGNLASQSNEGRVSRPRAAAMQGIAKMRLLLSMGIAQGVLPPQPRPDGRLLHALGFNGASDAQRFCDGWEKAPSLMMALMSASSMWAANAATVSPSADCADGRVHFTPANLHAMRHRAFEAFWTQRALKALFADEAHFTVHEPVFSHDTFADEGAANHMRLCVAQDKPGVEIFVYGRSEDDDARTDFPARQTRAAGEAIARRHGLDPDRTVYLRQSAAAIEAGAFHHDVVGVSHGQCLFQHEQAFDAPDWMQSVQRAAGFPLSLVTTPASEVSLADAVSSYLFNSQLVQRPDTDHLTLVAPQEAAENPATRAYLAGLVRSGGPIGEVVHVDLRESMRNGGGPACLRLRVALTQAELASVTPILATPQLLDALEVWVMRHYRETLSLSDLRDPALVQEQASALDALTAILPLGAGFYAY